MGASNIKIEYNKTVLNTEKFGNSAILLIMAWIAKLRCENVTVFYRLCTCKHDK